MPEEESAEYSVPQPQLRRRVSDRVGGWGKRTIKKMTYFKELPKSGVTDFKYDTTVGPVLKRIDYDKGLPQIDYESQFKGSGGKDVYKIQFREDAFKTPGMKSPEQMEFPKIRLNGNLKMPEGKMPPDVNLPDITIPKIKTNTIMKTDIPMDRVKMHQPNISSPKMALTIPGKRRIDEVEFSMDVKGMPDIMGNIKGKPRKKQIKYP
jgi:hypothetical protein